MIFPTLTKTLYQSFFHLGSINAQLTVKVSYKNIEFSGFSGRTHNAEASCSNDVLIQTKAPAVEKITGNHLMNSTYW